MALPKHDLSISENLNENRLAMPNKYVVLSALYLFQLSFRRYDTLCFSYLRCSQYRFITYNLNCTPDAWLLFKR